jgi:hypothetical protein
MVAGQQPHRIWLWEQVVPGEFRRQALFESEYVVRPSQWTNDDKILFFTETNPKTQGDIWYLRDPGGKPGAAKPVKFLATDANESQELSLDGRWLAYTVQGGPGPGVWVSSFPDGGTKYRVAAAGAQPKWSADGRELLYTGAGKMISVAVRTGATFSATPPQTLFPLRSLGYIIQANTYTAVPAKDGKRFLVSEVAPTQGWATLRLITNWHKLLQNSTK